MNIMRFYPYEDKAIFINTTVLYPAIFQYNPYHFMVGRIGADCI